MSNPNDSKIIELKKQIQEKRDKIDSTKRFSPITNCNFEFEETRYNINVLQKEQLTLILVKLNMYRLSVKDLELSNEFTISGYKLEEWIADIKSRIDILSRKDEEKKLKLMEDKLTELLSNEKKVELELDEIANMLK